MNWKQRLIWATLGLAACGAALAGQTNTLSKADYAFFKLIPDRNIFNPNRHPHRPGTQRTEPASTAPADTLTLVGTMSYEKGTFAFFDGSHTDCQKVLERNGEIAGFTLAAIQPNTVLLAAGTNSIELKVGAHLRRDAEAGWQLVQDTGMPPVERADAPTPSSPAGDASGDQNDVLKKLMQQREQELK